MGKIYIFQFFLFKYKFITQVMNCILNIIYANSIVYNYINKVDFLSLLLTSKNINLHYSLFVKKLKINNSNVSCNFKKFYFLKVLKVKSMNIDKAYDIKNKFLESIYISDQIYNIDNFLKKVINPISLKVINLSNSNIYNVDILDKYINLEKLSLRNTKVNNIGSLKNLNKLYYLDIGNTNIKSVEILNGKNIKYLFFDISLFEFINFKYVYNLPRLPKLKVLSLNSNFNNLNNILYCSKLIYLDIRYNVNNFDFNLLKSFDSNLTIHLNRFSYNSNILKKYNLKCKIKYSG